MKFIPYTDKNQSPFKEVFYFNHEENKEGIDECFFEKKIY